MASPSPSPAVQRDESAEEPAERTADEATALFAAVERRFPAGTLGEERWYLLTVFPPLFLLPLFLLLECLPIYEAVNVPCVRDAEWDSTI